ncbi:MAG TPA: hypothetical protein DCL76_03500 [Chloroflexi bacterium]|nr:hypothetical protein [Chloroflexota bacterium]HCU98647.1 hypothetical protein [Chloroflexota bacterium]|tara:strand:+ start:2233 stop:2424 length:192 start_codon:yes stop_codon:yes gene_type:complete
MNSKFHYVLLITLCFLIVGCSNGITDFEKSNESSQVQEIYATNPESVVIGNGQLQFVEFFSFY